jgi:aminoglycoside phosphotransferase (APT) family kinase protein
LGRPDLAEAVRKLGDRRPPERATVICHGDLHPFNLHATGDGAITVIDWTAAIRAEPAYDVAFTAMLLANPPLDAPGPLGAVTNWVGTRRARRFVARYQSIAPGHELGAMDWYRALHGTRILIEAAGIEARNEPCGAHPFGALVPAASSTATAFTRTPIAMRS